MKKNNSLIIFFIIIFCTIITTFIGCGNKDTAHLQEYLKNNYVSLNSANNLKSNFTILESDLKNNEVFLTGESHGLAENYELNLNFIKAFKEKAGIK